MPMLLLRQLIPPLTARTPAGQPVRAWDYKQKNSLLIAFLHGDCPHCQSFAARIASRPAELRELDAVALVIFLDAPPARLVSAPPVILASDTTGRAAQAYLGSDAFGSHGLARVGLFVADRYGELFAQWQARDAGDLPPLAEALKWLAHTQIVCEECSTPHWPAGE
jgi:peroxiredoxin